MRIVGFDMGTTTALCAIENGNVFLQTVKLSGKKRREKLGHFRQFLLEQVGCSESWLIAYERPFHRGAAPTAMGFGLAGVLESHFSTNNIVDYTVSTIKKFATGSGTADKDSMMLAAELAGASPKNDHEADAFFVAKMAEEKFLKGSKA